MEPNVILKYRREADCWLCPECDSENGLLQGRCTVCGFKRDDSAEILKKWSPADDVIYTPTRGIVNPPPPRNLTHTPISRLDGRSDDMYEPAEKRRGNGAVIAICIIIAFFFLAVIIMASQA